MKSNPEADGKEIVGDKKSVAVLPNFNPTKRHLVVDCCIM